MSRLLCAIMLLTFICSCTTIFKPEDVDEEDSRPDEEQWDGEDRIDDRDDRVEGMEDMPFDNPFDGQEGSDRCTSDEECHELNNENFKCCDGVCLDVTLDTYNCGDCGMACPAGKICRDRGCTGCVVHDLDWSPDGEFCYLIGYEGAGMGKYSYIGHLVPAVDPRVMSPPHALYGQSYQPSFGFYTVDNIYKGGDRERDYKVEVRYWDSFGHVEEVWIDDPDDAGLLALDAFTMMFDVPLVVYAGLTHYQGAGNDAFIMIAMNTTTGIASTMIEFDTSGDSPVIEDRWELPLPYEFASSIAVADDFPSDEYWRLYTGGAVQTDLQRRAKISADEYGLGEWQHEPPEGSESVVSSLAYAPWGDGKLYALVTVFHDDSSTLQLYCLDTGGITNCSNDGWNTGPLQLGEEGDGRKGSGLIVLPSESVVFSYVDVDGNTKLGRAFSNKTVQASYDTTLRTDPADDCERKARVSTLLADSEDNVYIIGYMTSECSDRNYHKTQSIWKVAREGTPVDTFGGQGRSDHSEGIFSDAMWLCDGTILVRSWHNVWDAASEDYYNDNVCLMRLDRSNGRKVVDY